MIKNDCFWVLFDLNGEAYIDGFYKVKCYQIS